MRLLWINHIFIDTAMYSTFPLLLIDKLSKSGHKVHLIIPSNTKKSFLPLFNDTKYLPTIRLPVLSSLSFFLMLLFYLPKAIKNKNPDVIIGNIADYPGLIITKLFRNIKLVLDVRASIGKRGVSGLIERILYYTAIKIARAHICDGITVTSPALKEELCTLGMDRARVEVVTNGVSLDLFDYKKNIVFSRELKKELHVSEKFIVMYHGSLGPRRGLLETIEAIARIKAKHPDIFFFILGAGSYEDKLKHLIEEKSLTDNVYIHKPVSHERVPSFLSICDLGIVPLDIFSYPRTSCPLKLLECLAMEKPVITTDIPFSREILEHGKCGILIPSNNPENIVAAIEYMYERRNSLKQIGKIGRAIIEQHYTWEEKAKDLENFIGVLSK